jgi:DNA polymerase III subunit gamma/tau
VNAEPLALKYRPRRFSDMVGQDLNATVLEQMVKTVQVPTGLLFSGPSGVGKTTAARILAHELNGVENDQFVTEVDAASNGGVAEVRKLIDSLRYGTGSAYRIVILDEAHSMTREAFNTLLKTLEEPPAGVIFVLVTTEPHKIPATILSRLMEFTFRSVSPEAIAKHLKWVCEQEGLEQDLSVGLVLRIAHEAAGNVRSALMSLDLAQRAGIRTVQGFVDLNGLSDDTPELLRLMLQGDIPALVVALDTACSRVSHPAVVIGRFIRALRDILVLRSGGRLDPPNDTLRDLALRIPNERVLAALRTLWDARVRLRSAVDPRADLDLVAILITEVLSRGLQDVVKTPDPHMVDSTPIGDVVPAQEAMPTPEPERRLTLADLQRLR